TVRYELWQLPDDQPGGPYPDQNFPGASLVFSRYNDQDDTLHLLTGPEFLRTDSYWLYTRIKKARPGQTKLRLYLSKYNAMPNMAPVFFWSTDQRHWQRATLLEPSTGAGLFQPLLTAPAEDFYLSSSLPFLDLEREELCRQAAALPYINQEIIGHSVAGNPITMLTATDLTVPPASKQDILIIIGQHSPQEMIGGHAILPLLTELANQPGLLQRLALHIVPTVNVDAAAYGSNGANLNLFNTNRCWFENPQPETEAIKSWCLREPRRLLLFFDWHAGGVWRNHTLLWFNREVKNTYAPNTAERLEQRQQTVFELLGRHCGIRPEDSVEHPFRNFCATDWFLVNFPECLPLTLEFSTCRNFDPRLGHTVPVSQDTIAMIGRQLAVVLQELIAAKT
ncbi:MAG TPA: M14 family zinc carboxypeptidase, partial [Lentisphaeria bacterium]|nr:M14 family zinc carboxypeptidase [Lentisphaeria bacterium]